jgi:hypothetical protein
LDAVELTDFGRSAAVRPRYCANYCELVVASVPVVAVGEGDRELSGPNLIGSDFASKAIKAIIRSKSYVEDQTVRRGAAVTASPVLGVPVGSMSSNSTSS